MKNPDLFLSLEEAASVFALLEEFGGAPSEDRHTFEHRSMNMQCNEYVCLPKLGDDGRFWRLERSMICTCAGTERRAIYDRIIELNNKLNAIVSKPVVAMDEPDFVLEETLVDRIENSLCVYYKFGSDIVSSIFVADRVLFVESEEDNGQYIVEYELADKAQRLWGEVLRPVCDPTFDLDRIGISVKEALKFWRGKRDELAEVSNMQMKEVYEKPNTRLGDICCSTCYVDAYASVLSWLDGSRVVIPNPEAKR